MTLPDNPAYIPFLQFLQRQQRAEHRPYMSQRTAMCYLGLVNDADYYEFIGPLQQDKLVGTGIGNIGLTLEGEEYVLSREQKGEREQLAKRLLAELEKEVARKAQEDISLARIVEEVTGKPTKARASFSDTFVLAQLMGADPYELRGVALRLANDKRVEIFPGSEYQDRVCVRLLPIDVKALMDVHRIVYDEDELSC